MKFIVIGTGYVGLVTGTCFADMGHNVICIDKDKTKIENLKNGIIPIYEPGLTSLITKNYNEERLKFSVNLEQNIKNYNIFFIAVGTPSLSNGSVDMQSVIKVAKQIGQNINNNYTLIINKSTVPVGTADKIKSIIQEELIKRNLSVEFDIVSNPEFLKEGSAINDFVKPDRIIIGSDSLRAIKLMKRIYSSFSRNREKLIIMNTRDAEMTKYVANSMLATKISFMNEISNICEILGVDVENVRKGIGSDSRIGYSFIYPGCGYGGSCFPKDVKALIKLSKDQGFNPELLNAVEQRNNIQKYILSSKIIKRFGQDLSNMVFCIWGLSFKPGTDDIRESPSIEIIKELIKRGSTIKAFDPVAMNRFREELPEDWFLSGKLILTDNQYECIKNTDGLILVTEWKMFVNPDFEFISNKMRQKIIFDGRNQYDPSEVKEFGFEYYGIGR